MKKLEGQCRSNLLPQIRMRKTASVILASYTRVSGKKSWNGTSMPLSMGAFRYLSGEGGK